MIDRLVFTLNPFCVALLLIGPSASVAGNLNVGFAEKDITPPIGFRMGGDYSERISTGVHDPLKAKAMFLQQDQVPFAIVVCDLLSVPEPISSAVRAKIEREMSIPSSNVIVAATHNHGAPEYWGSLRDIFHEASIAKEGSDPHEKIDYQRLLADACVAAIELARRNAVVARGELIVASQQGIAFNRRFHMRDGSVRFNPGRRNPLILRPAGPIDPELPFLLFRSTETGQPVGSFCVYALHTAVATGSEFGADFPGRMELRLQRSMGESFVSVFAEGAAGDINHIDVHSKPPKRDMSDWIGASLADTILGHLDDARPLRHVSLAVRSETIEAPLIEVSKQRYVEARKQLEEQKSNRLPFRDLVAAWRDIHAYRYGLLYGAVKPMEVQAVRIDRDTAIVALPHEIFVEMGIAIKSQSPFRNTIVVSLANDVDFYVPTRRAFEEGSYEVTTCPMQPGCGELLVDAARDLLLELKRNLPRR